jgi:hypothetical protein
MRVQPIATEPASLVPDFEQHFSACRGETNRDGARRRMTMDIREAFLHDTEEGDLDRPRQAPDIVKGHDDVNAASAGETLREQADGRYQTGFIEQRRVQQVRVHPHLPAALICQGSTFGEYLGASSVEDRRVLFEESEIHAQHRQILRDRVV